MFSLSVCVEPFSRVTPFEERVRAINRMGLWAEFWRWMPHPIDKIADDPVVRISIISGTNKGSMVHPDGVASYLDGVSKSLAIAKRLKCQKLILITGEVGPNGEIVHQIASNAATRWITAYKTLCRLAEMAEVADVVFALEHLNTKVDHPGYPLPLVEDVVRLLEQVASPRIKLLFDIYHAQVEEGNIIQLITDYGKYIGHVHVADVPGRHEPGTGEINYPRVVEALHAVGYQGTVGLEAWPECDEQLAIDRFCQIFATSEKHQPVALTN